MIPALHEFELHHVGIVVADIDAAAEKYAALGFRDGERFEIPEQGIVAITYHAGHGYTELIQPTNPDGAIAKFMAKRGEGMHHVAYRVADLEGTLAALAASGVRLIDETPRTGAHGWRIAFIHPEAGNGVLIELVDDRTAS
ncbi:MAG: methylmalonyl-CoA epimerase [Thermomicrobiales bacterium]|nr:methylmalonyl-CoA epimerase [Thermomicrobiales bacterium]